MSSIFKSLWLAATLGMATTAYAQNVKVATGQYSPDWESLSQWECPEWFKDVKFGIWAHWGPQCHAEAGDWYARGMYYKDNGQYRYNCEHFGDPSVYGLKEHCRDWKAENWDPEKLIELYKSVGARYFFTLGQHHDNFDLWDSPYQEWNSVNMGPKRDIVKGWSDACKKYDLPFGISMHGSHTWTWLEASQDFDGNLTKEDGKGQWWEGYDPQELYAQRHRRSEANGANQWDWQNGASLPSIEFRMKFQNRVLQCVNTYRPDILYFDDTVLPFYGCDESVGLNIMAHMYNTIKEPVLTGKVLEDWQKEALMWDVERGVPDRAQEKYWQTCTCIGDWHYNKAHYDHNWYKSAQQVVDMLIDIVSKNGNMLLSVPLKSDGTLDDKEMNVLMGIKAWMDQNSESIYGTRPWKIFGEGPQAEGNNKLKDQGFNEKNDYSAADVRYVQKDGTLYATIMRWPAEKTFTFKALGTDEGNVATVTLLGKGKVSAKQTKDGLTVTLPKKPVNDIAPVFAVTFKK